MLKRRGELTPTAEVDQGGRDAVALMQAAYDRAVETEAATASVRYGWDERVARIVLKGFARRGLERLRRWRRPMPASMHKSPARASKMPRDYEARDLANGPRGGEPELRRGGGSSAPLRPRGTGQAQNAREHPVRTS